MFISLSVITSLASAIEASGKTKLGSLPLGTSGSFMVTLSPVLDVEDPIDREYHLEVSSPGIDRPLVRARDYRTYLGHEAKVELSDALDGRKRFRGTIAASTADTVTIHLPDVPKDTSPDFVLPLASIAEAKLVMTDRLLNMAQTDQSEFPIDDGDDVETVELDSNEEHLTEEIE